jgi:hypothetical protein
MYVISWCLVNENICNFLIINLKKIKIVQEVYIKNQ